jgi:hypothetical protein
MSAPSRWLTALLSGTVLAAVFLVAPLQAVAAVSPQSGLNTISIDEQSRHELWTGGQITSSYSAHDALILNGQGGGSSESVLVQAPQGGSFILGETYPTASSPTPTRAGLSSTPRCSGPCNAYTFMTVLELGRDDVTGSITSFAATYWSYADYFEPPYRITLGIGELRWHSSVDLIRFGQVPSGTAAPLQSVVVTNTAAEPTTFGAANLTGQAPEAFSVVSDSCSGRTVVSGGTCALSLRGWAVRDGLMHGLLAMSDSATGSNRYVSLGLEGMGTVEGMFTATRPARILDTRNHTGTTGAALGPGKTLDLQVTGAVIPTFATAVVLNLTVASPSADGYLTAYPTGTTRSTTSSINFPRGWTGANLITVRLGAGGKISIYNNSGSTQVIGDVLGYYRSNAWNAFRYGGYHPVAPTRLFDTRTWGQGQLGPDDAALVSAHISSAITPHISAVAVTVTAVGGSKAGFLSAYDGANPYAPSGTSTVNYTAGRTVANMAIVPVSCPCSLGQGFTILNRSTGSVHAVVDVVGFFDDGTLPGELRFHGLTKPQRIADSRSATGFGTLGPAQFGSVSLPASIGDANTRAVVTNLTAVAPSSSTYLTAYGAGTVRPGTSNVNPLKGQTVTNMTVTEIGTGRGVSIFNKAGTTNVLMDVAGTMDRYPALPVGLVLPEPAHYEFVSGGGTLFHVPR